jgi:hypothetical protein
MPDFEEIAKRAKEKADAQEAAEAKAFADGRTAPHSTAGRLVCASCP